MIIKNSCSCSIDLDYVELGVIYRALDSYTCGDLNCRAEFMRAKTLKSAIHSFLHHS